MQSLLDTRSEKIKLQPFSIHGYIEIEKCNFQLAEKLEANSFFNIKICHTAFFGCLKDKYPYVSSSYEMART